MRNYKNKRNKHNKTSDNIEDEISEALIKKLNFIKLPSGTKVKIELKNLDVSKIDPISDNIIHPINSRCIFPGTVLNVEIKFDMDDNDVNVRAIIVVDKKLKLKILFFSTPDNHKISSYEMKEWETLKENFIDDFNFIAKNLLIEFIKLLKKMISNPNSIVREILIKVVVASILGVIGFFVGLRLAG